MNDYLEIHRAIRCGNIEAVKKLCNEQIFYSIGPLKLALEYGSLDMIKLVCEKSNLAKEDIISIAVARCNLRIISYLLDKGATITNDALFIAINIERTKVIELFVRRGYKDDGSACYKAIELSKMNMLKYLHEYGFIWDNRLFKRILFYHLNVDFLVYLHENGYFDDVNIEYDESDFYYVGNRTREYCHDNKLPKQWPCKKKCYECRRQRVDIIRSIWEMENTSYDNVVQWLPNETLEDILMLLI